MMKGLHPFDKGSNPLLPSKCPCSVVVNHVRLSIGRLGCESRQGYHGVVVIMVNMRDLDSRDSSSNLDDPIKCCHGVMDNIGDCLSLASGSIPDDGVNSGIIQRQNIQLISGLREFNSSYHYHGSLAKLVRHSTDIRATESSSLSRAINMPIV